MPTEPLRDRPPRATIFDCDGTLVDSESVATEVLLAFAAEHGRLELGLTEAMTRFRGVRMDLCIAELERLLGRSLPAEFQSRLRERTAEAFRARLRPMEGALGLVRSLAGPICVASSGPRVKIELSLTLTGLLPYFEGRIYSSYEIGSWKPEPDLFLHAARSLGVEPRECAVVEDSLPGIIAGIAAGMRVFALQPHGDDPGLPPEATVVRSLAELRAYLA